MDTLWLGALRTARPCQRMGPLFCDPLFGGPMCGLDPIRPSKLMRKAGIEKALETAVRFCVILLKLTDLLK